MAKNKSTFVLPFLLVLLSNQPGCQRANSGTHMLEGKAEDLELTKEQISFVERTVPKILLWQQYWTSLDEDAENSSYRDKTVPVLIYGLDGAVITYVPDLGKTVIHVRMPDGQLDYGGFAGWTGTEGAQDLDSVLDRPLSSASWSTFLLLLRSSARSEMKLSAEQIEKYTNLFPGPTSSDKTTPRYWRTNGTIRLLEATTPIYEPTGETKQCLLDRIIKESKRQSEMLFEVPHEVRISIPDFNVGDPLIWVLLENKTGGGAIVSIQLTTNPQQHPVILSNVVTYDIKANKNGLGFEKRSVNKIKSHLLRTA